MRISTRKPIPGDAGDPQSLSTMLRRYLFWMETHNYATGTVTIRRTNLSLFIEWCLDRDVTQSGDVTREMIERYQRHLFHYRKSANRSRRGETTSDGERLSISTQVHRLSALRRWFTWLTRERHIRVNPAAEMELPREEHRLPRNMLTQSEAEAVMEQPNITTVFGLRDRAMLETFYSTGIRRAELAALELSDIDHERRTVLIRLGKGRKDRVVPIGDRALAWIDKYEREARSQFVCDSSQCVLFLTKTGRPMHVNHLSQLVRNYVERAGIAKCGGCHLFRHTTATLMLEGGADVRFIQAMLGHSKLTTTQIYTQVSIKKLSEVHEQTHPARFHRKPQDE